MVKGGGERDTDVSLTWIGSRETERDPQANIGTVTDHNALTGGNSLVGEVIA